MIGQKCLDPVPDERMENAFKSRSSGGIGEDKVAHSRAIKRAGVGQKLASERLYQRGNRQPTGTGNLCSDSIRIQDRDGMRRKQLSDG